MSLLLQKPDVLTQSENGLNMTQGLAGALGHRSPGLVSLQACPPSATKWGNTALPHVPPGGRAVCEATENSKKFLRV